MEIKTFQNPMNFNTADPVILYYEGKYYCYGTNAYDGYKVFSSTDLTNWGCEGYIFKKYEGFCGVDCFWAPEVYFHGGRFILTFSCRDENKRRHQIYIATSDSPKGPFIDINDGKPFFAPDYSVIDANLLFDDDGRVYMYYSKDCSTNIINGIKESHLYVVEISKDLKTVLSEPVFCTCPDNEWEKKSGDKVRWNEGPCAFKRNGIYYLMYTANCYTTIHYAVGYATSKSPLGPFLKSPSNPILCSDGINTMGTGHNNYFLSPDKTQMYIVYHSLKNKVNCDEGRVPNIDLMVFDAEGNLSIAGPTVTAQPLPSSKLEIKTK